MLNTIMISVIVPVYKAEKFLSKCIDSILQQTFQDIELILVDDGSPDNCPAICDAYARQDSRVVVIHQKNAGVAAARNAGLSCAKGEYVTFVDSDDYIDCNMYESMMNVADEYHCDVVMCDCLKEYGDRSELYTHNIREGYYNRHQLEKEYFQHLLMMPNVEYPPTISNWLLVFKNNHYLRYKVGIRYSEDLLFGALVMYYANSFYYMKGQAFYHYNCMNQQSATHTFVPDKWKDYQKLHRYIQEEFSNVLEFDFSKQIDLCLLFFVYNAVGDIKGTKQLTHQEKVKKIKEILSAEVVKTMFKKVKINKLPISWKQKILTLFYKCNMGIGLICKYYGT